jgi:vacuolar-type H+-ATPase subunit E/Vma4
MGMLEDIRKVIQDLVAPDLKAISVRLDGIEKLMSHRFDALNEKLDSMATQEQVSHLNRRIDMAIDYTKMREQMDEIQKWRQEVSGKTTKQ